MAREDLEPFDPDWETCEHSDWHAVVTIQLGELIEAEIFDLTREDWDFGPKYSQEQHARLCEKITAHYYWREIGIVPVKRWKHEFLRKLNEIMPKAVLLYKAADSDLTSGTESEWYKSRNIFSDFPQTALAGRNQDYASTGNDTEYERIKQANPLETAKRLEAYADVDLWVVKQLEPLFSCLFTVNINGF